MKRTKTLNLIRFPQKMRLLDSVVLVIVLLIVIILLLIGLVFSRQLFDFALVQKEKIAIETARNLSELPYLGDMLADFDKHDQLKQLLQKFRQSSESASIIMTDLNGIILIHSNSPITGIPLQNPYIRQALEEGNSYAYHYKNNDIKLISGTAPVRNASGKIVGLISISFKAEFIHFITRRYLEETFFYIFLFFIFALCASLIIAQGVKNAIFGLEPVEIANLFQTRTAIIESIRSGVLACDKNSIIILKNSNAEELLNLKGQEIVGVSLASFFPKPLIDKALKENVPVHDTEVVVKGITMRCNILPFNEDQHTDGVVATFRKKDEIDLITGELSQITRYSELLRAQTHEYSNQLHTIAGLIQTEDYQSVLDLIAEETDDQKKILRLLMKVVDDTSLRSLLLGKHMHARELKIDFEIDPESSMNQIPQDVSRHQLTTILGNLIENAFEATQQSDRPRKVFLSMSDFSDLIFEIEDSGPGIKKEMVESIFERGITSKQGDGHGIGLHLVHNALLALDGSISILESDLGGARFTVILHTFDRESHDRND